MFDTVCIKPGQRLQLIYRVHPRPQAGAPESDCARLLEAARQQLTGGDALLTTLTSSCPGRGLWPFPLATSVGLSSVLPVSG
jgi:hypothetical protein